MDIKEKALAYRDAGFNCAQAVLAACAEYTGLDEKTALAVSAGLGGGVRGGEICGAATGAVLAFGAAFPFTEGTDAAAKDNIAGMAKEFVEDFREKYGCVRCEELKAAGCSCEELILSAAEAAENFILNNK